MIIWGEKIGLRRFEERLSEAEQRRVYEWSRDIELLRWSGGSRLDLTFADFQDHLDGEQRWGPSNRRAFFIIRRDNQELIGRLGLFSIDWDKRQGELGIIIGEKKNWGQGYGRDAIQTFLNYIFRTSSIERIYLFTFPDNERAQRAFAASGFRPIRVAQRYVSGIGEFDGLEMEITRREYLEREKNKPKEKPAE